jgi:hypothetical protein
VKNTAVLPGDVFEIIEMKLARKAGTWVQSSAMVTQFSITIKTNVNIGVTVQKFMITFEKVPGSVCTKLST